MPTFAYSGRTRAGQTVTGERVADTVDGAIAALRREQIQVTRIDPAKAAAKARAGSKKGPAAPSKKSRAFSPAAWVVTVTAGPAGAIS